MPAKPSGEIKTKIVPVPQKNGDIYLMERQIQYDPVKKYNRMPLKSVNSRLSSILFINEHTLITVLGESFNR